MVSGLSMPIGFKNSTSGDKLLAINAILSASYPHCFMGITDKGEPAICKKLKVIKIVILYYVVEEVLLITPINIYNILSWKFVKIHKLTPLL